MCFKSILSASLVLFSVVRSHSWVSCTDYHADIQGLDYTPSECTGWIRGWDFNGVTFAADRGVNHQVGVGSNQQLCQRTLTGDSTNMYSGSYTDTTKIAQYTIGSTVRVVWPAKNHANYECSSNIPDTSMKLYMNPQVNPTTDLSNDDSTMLDQGYELVKDWQEGCTAGTDDCGFQNCRRYCEDTGAAVCFGDFIVPNVDTSGYYTFVWYWIFNPGSPYISCWEAYIDISGSATTPNDTSTSDDNSNNVNGYITQLPVCIDGHDYDETTLMTFLESHFDMLESDQIEILRLDEGTSAYNVTTQFSIADSEVSSMADLVDDFCNEYESTHSGTTCERCGDYVVYARYAKSSANGGGSSTNSGMIAALILLPLVLIAIGLGVWYLKRTDKNKSEENTKNIQQSQNLATTQQSNQIVQA